MTEHPGLVFLGFLLGLYLYFIPALLAFYRGHRRFWVIFGLNVLLDPLQGVVRYFLPAAGLAPETQLVLPFLLASLPGWILLLIWASRPVAEPDARLANFRNTKLFDFLAAFPLIVWFALNVFWLRPNLARAGHAIAAGVGGLQSWLLFLSLLFSALFCLLSVYLLVIRDKPVLRSRGIFPHVAAIAGTFLGVGLLGLPVAPLNLPLQALAFFLTGLGSAASTLILWRLGKSFSIMPEARKLVTAGPYAYARHPLYAAEIVTVIGMTIQYQQPWALLMGGSVVVLQVTRSLFEEQVLAQAFPEYEAYRARTKRFIPGVI
jgi:protein-S-isoprenylcysteine O-methyltransferase Ste14